MNYLKKVRNGALSVFAVLFALSANTAGAIWTSPSKPSGVPTDFDNAILNATNWILGFVGMIAVLMLIWGGVNYLTSAGDEEKAKTGKKTVSYAIVGLVIAGIAYAVVNVIVTTILS